VIDAFVGAFDTHGGGSIMSTSVETDTFADQLLTRALGTAETLSVYVGDRLGWYGLLAAGPLTSRELADRSATHERYAREWLEHQAVAGLVRCDDAVDAHQRRYWLSPAAAEVLTDPASLAYLTPLARMFAAAAIQLPALLEAYRTGGGVGWAQFGADARESQADMNRPWFEQVLGRALAGVGPLHERLSRPGTRIADVGCGAGWSSIALARAYPDAVVDGYDIDAESVDMARANAAEAGLADRVRFTASDAAGLPGNSFDAVFAFECVHDMPYPVDVLTAARNALRDGGSMIVMDEAVASEFGAQGDELERLMYGFSMFVCLPDGMSHPDSAGTGTAMRPATLRDYGARAGLGTFEVLPIEDFGFWRFYRLAS
jgi:SAM-dependent methyltransferase